jgi:hypothetical protein
MIIGFTVFARQGLCPHKPFYTSCLWGHKQGQVIRESCTCYLAPSKSSPKGKTSPPMSFYDNEVKYIATLKSLLGRDVGRPEKYKQRQSVSLTPQSKGAIINRRVMFSDSSPKGEHSLRYMCLLGGTLGGILNTIV